VRVVRPRRTLPQEAPNLTGFTAGSSPVAHLPLTPVKPPCAHLRHTDLLPDETRRVIQVGGDENDPAHPGRVALQADVVEADGHGLDLCGRSDRFG
jgi:hypothetical protein